MSSFHTPDPLLLDVEAEKNTIPNADTLDKYPNVIQYDFKKQHTVTEQQDDEDEKSSFIEYVLLNARKLSW